MTVEQKRFNRRANCVAYDMMKGNERTEGQKDYVRIGPVFSCSRKKEERSSK